MDTPALERLIQTWPGESVVMAYDAPTEAWIFIALHDTRLGPAVGGTRLHVYPRPADGLRDAMRLAEGMTFKWAGVGIPFGGGKAVLAAPRALEPAARDGLLDRYARRLRSLRGAFLTGVDLGTTPDDMARVAGIAPYVKGIVDGRSVDPGPYTALGVYSGLVAALRSRFGSPSPEGRAVLIQGVGDVGEPLARRLAGAGARLLLCDVDEDHAARVARELGGETVPPERMWEPEVEVYAPCAIGATVNPRTIPNLRCAVIAGSANNQLESSEDADALHEHEILYAPDYIINAGGAIAFGRMHGGERDEDAIRAEVEGIGDTLTAIFEEAAAADESPLRAARRRAERFLRSAEDSSVA